MIRKITKVKRSIRGISPVIATLLMIAIAVIASLIVYAWVIGYIGSGTTKASNSMLIQSASHSDGPLVVYVQNVGQGTLELNQDQSVYVNSILQNIDSSSPALLVGKVTFSPGTTAALTTDYYPNSPNEKLKIKVTATDGTFAEYTTTGLTETTTGTFPAWPTAHFTMSNSNPTVGQPVIFTDTSIRGEGTINQWAWNFGDGATSSTKNPNHAYSTTGTKIVTLTITDTNSKTAITTHTLIVSDFASPVASFTFAPSSPAISQTVTFSDTSIAGSGTINQWSWNFGSDASPSTSNAHNPSASYSAAGQKTVTLTVTNTNGKTSTTTRQVNAAYDAPTAEFTMSPLSPGVGQTITFTDASIPGTGAINQWSWNFGDSTSSTTQNPTHSYSTSGSKTITLTVTDTNAKTSAVTRTITVTAALDPVASFSFTPTVPIVGQTVTFSDTSIAGSGTINQWSWSFGTGASPSTSSVQNPSSSYSSAGQKTISLTVTDSNGKTSTTTQTLQVDSVTATPTPGPSSSVTPTPNPSSSPTPTPNPTSVQITLAINPAGSGTTTPTGTQNYNYGQTVNIQANAAAGYTFSSWTYNGIIEVNNPAGSSTTATMLGDGTITANFISSSGNKLVFTSGTNQILARNVGSSVVTVQRQTSAGSAISSGTTNVYLTTTSSGGKFYSNAACTNEITTYLTINSGSTATFYYKDSTTGTPTITATATGFASAQTTFNVNILYSNFDGSNWLAGWTTGTQPPWYQSALGEGVDGTQAAKSDSTNYLGGNDGPFTSDVIDTSMGNTMTVTFIYKVQNTDNANDLRIAWSNSANPNLGQNSGDFHYFDSIGLQNKGQSLGNGWNSYTVTFTRAANPTMFTTHFWFRFESSLTTHQGSGLVESVWVDNAMISVT